LHHLADNEQPVQWYCTLQQKKKVAPADAVGDFIRTSQSICIIEVNQGVIPLFLFWIQVLLAFLPAHPTDLA